MKVNGLDGKNLLKPALIDFFFLGRLGVAQQDENTIPAYSSITLHIKQTQATISIHLKLCLWSSGEYKSNIHFILALLWPLTPEEKKKKTTLFSP